MLDTVKSRVNGLDLAALGEVVQAIEADPGQALAGFEVTTRWTGQTRSESEIEAFTLGGERIARSHRIVADEPCELLGSDGAHFAMDWLASLLPCCPWSFASRWRSSPRSRCCHRRPWP